MRLSSLWPVPSELRLLILSQLLFSSITRAIDFQRAPSPNLDLSGLGSVMLAGDFDAISLYQYDGQTEDGLSPNGSQSLYGRYPTGAFAELLASDGHIESMCAFRSDGMFNGIVLGGNFTGFGSTQASAAALYTPGSPGSIQPLSGINGQINTVFCDDEASTVYVGGNFAAGNSTNAIAWVTGWTNLPFAGFNGPVSAITKMPNGNIVFGGQFSQIGNLSEQTHMLPVQPQVVNVGSANLTVNSGSSDPRYSNASDIICTTAGQGGNSFLLEDNTPGSITAEFGYAFSPSRLRLLNTQVENHGTAQWSMNFYPQGGIANFTYFDEDGEQSCTSACPLANNGTYQDFYFVNSVMMNGLRLNLQESYGVGAGLDGIQLLQDAIWAYAIDNYNSPNCDGVSNSNASSQITGDWNRTPMGNSMSQYLTAFLPDGTKGEDTDLSVVFTPNIERSGNYSINMWTPGCTDDNTCATRGKVNITANFGSPTGTSSAPYSTTIYQTNNNLKFDQIYYGYVDAGTDGFRPSITLTPSSGQSGPLTVVAQSLGLNLTAAFDGSGRRNRSSASTSSDSSYTVVNGLYEYNPDMAFAQTTSSNSSIDAAGTSLNEEAEILALAMDGNTLYAAGTFRTDSFRNILAVESGNATDLANGGLNDAVQTLLFSNGVLYAGGNFTNSADRSVDGLRNVASYSGGSWQALGAGVNGIVYDIVPLQVNVSGRAQDVIAVSGFFDEINAFGDNEAATVQNMALWVPSANNWLQNMQAQSIAVSGRLNAYTPIPGQDPLYAGSIDSQALGARRAVGLSSDKPLSLEQYPITFQQQAQSESSDPTKRDIPQGSTDGAYTGLFYEDTGLNLTIIGGHFTARATNGSRISNLAIVNGTTKSETITGLAYNGTSDTSVYAIDTEGATLYVGGSFTDGILFYDLQQAQLASSQPPGLSGNDGEVHAIALQPKTNNLYVGGSFERAGSLGCPSLCIYDTAIQQWNPPANSLSSDSTINILQWASNTRLMLAGDLSIAGNRSTMAEFNSKTNTFTTVTNADTLPGPITAFTPVDNSFTSVWVAGTSSSDDTAYLSHFDGSSTWQSVDGLGPQTRIQGLQILSVTSGHRSTSIMSSNQALLVMGMLNLPSYGNVSAALYNGTDFRPFALGTRNDGQPGSIYGAFVQNPAALLNRSTSHLALGFIVLIALACALGVIFLLVVLGILIERLRRKREGYMPAPTGAVMYEKTAGGKVGEISAGRLFGGVGKGGGGPRI